MLTVSCRARWYFAYVNDVAIGDHFRTLHEFKAAVDDGHFQGKSLLF